MSKFFRIKSKPKINVGRREAGKSDSSEKPADSQNVKGSDKQLQENLGKALEQQLLEKYEVDETNLSSSIDLPSGDTFRETVTKQPTQEPTSLISDKSSERHTNIIYSSIPETKITTIREISFKDNVCPNKNEADNSDCGNELLAAEPTNKAETEKQLNNTAAPPRSLSSREIESVSKSHKGFFRVKLAPKFNSRNKTVQDNLKGHIVNEDDTLDKVNEDTGDINNASVEMNATEPSKSFFRVKSKPIIGLKRTASSKTAHTEIEEIQNVGRTVDSEFIVENIHKIDSEGLEPHETHVDPNNEETQKGESCSLNLQGKVVSKKPPDEKQLSVSIEQTSNSTIIMTSVDYPPPPPSPTKITRIKAVPRFSESDGSRHHGRIRNVSVCSVMSTAAEGIIDSAGSKEVLPIIQKKINRTEQSRKLAEARKEFQKRFGVKSPDKQKLKMIDLLFYNPTSNPMTEPKEKKPSLKIEKSEENQSDNDATMIDDDHNKCSQTTENQPEEEELPVPQIKIGPNGEIILDEQSLVIENEEIKKQKEDILKSDIVDGDFNTGYGVFKRAPRSKDWTHKETLRFYKALNVLGTDFSLMAELFTNRSRREIKMKFKKEEKINGHLINKAITLPCCYNYDQLKHDFHAEQEEEKELLRIAEEEAHTRMERSLKRKERKQEDFINEDIKPKRPKIASSRVVSREFVSDSSSDDEEAIKKVILEDDKIAADENLESDEEAAMPILLPTRSGRIPKSRNAEQAQLVSMPPPQLPGPKILPRRRRSSSMSSTVSNESNLENAVVGSIMVMAEDGPDGKPIYKSYMVTPERSLTPLNVESEVIAKVIDYKPNDPAESNEVRDDNREEVNVTIPASDSVVDLRTENSKNRDKSTEATVTPVSYSPPGNKNGVSVIEEDNYTVEVVKEDIMSDPDLSGV